jgi:copper chaperone CopZ
VSVAVKDLDGVESVDVSLANASADIRLRPDNRLKIERLRQVIRRAGYPTKDALITARGKSSTVAANPRSIC